MVAACVGLLLVVPVPVAGREVNAIMDLGHVPLFGAMAWGLYLVLRRRTRLSSAWAALVAWTAVVAAGVAVEGIQKLTGRYPSWHDVSANALGSAAAIVLATRPTRAGHADRAGRLLLATTLVVLPAIPPGTVLYDSYLRHRDRPRLATFEDPIEMSRWSFLGCRGERVRGHATDGVWSLRVDLGRDTLAGANLDWSFRDWSPYRELVGDLDVDGAGPLDVEIKIKDGSYDETYEGQFHRHVRLQPGRNTLRIPFLDIEGGRNGRPLDLSDIRRLHFVAAPPDGPRTYYLDNLRLR